MQRSAVHDKAIQLTSQVTCGVCAHFIPDEINPPAGMGDCARVLGMWHPMAPHRCAGFEGVE